MEDEKKVEEKAVEMKDHKCCECPECHECCHHHHKGMRMGGGGANAVYGVGMLGALIYFIGNAANLGEGLFGVLKAIIWPAYFVYYIFEYLGIPI